MPKCRNTNWGFGIRHSFVIRASTFVIWELFPMIRIIPKLDIKGPNLVKGIHLEGLRVLGKPEAFSRFYYEQGADELIYMDAVASLYGRNSLLDIVARTAKEVLIP